MIFPLNFINAPAKGMAYFGYSISDYFRLQIKSESFTPEATMNCGYLSAVEAKQCFKDKVKNVRVEILFYGIKGYQSLIIWMEKMLTLRF